MNEIKLFTNNQLNLQVRTIVNPDGSISVNAEDTAIGYGWTQTQTKNRMKYTSIRWERMNAFSAECGFPHEWGNEEYLPESLFYILGFKANNDRALKYQQWLAMEVLPTLRKTGTYTLKSQTPVNSESTIPQITSDLTVMLHTDLEILKTIDSILQMQLKREATALRANPSATSALRQLSVLPQYQTVFFQVADELLDEVRGA